MSMKLRTVALAVALACGFTGPMEAKQQTKNQYHSKPGKAKKFKAHKYKSSKYKSSKFKPAKVK